MEEKTCLLLLSDFSIRAKVREIQVCLLSSFTNIIVDVSVFCWSHLRTRTATSEVVVQDSDLGAKNFGKWEMGRLVAQTLTWGKVCGYCRRFHQAAEPAVPLPQEYRPLEETGLQGWSSFIRQEYVGLGSLVFRDM